MARSAIVAGTGFEGRAEVIKEYCKDGRPAYLTRERNNDYDENAVAVSFSVPWLLGIFGKKKLKIGYIKSGTAKHVAKRLDSGENIKAIVKSFYAPEGRDHPRVTLELDI